MNKEAIKVWMKSNGWMFDKETETQLCFLQGRYFRDYNIETGSYVQGHLDTVINLISRKND